MWRAALLTSTVVWACNGALPSSGSGAGGQAIFTPASAGAGDGGNAAGGAAFDASGSAGLGGAAEAAVAGGTPAAGGESNRAESGAAGSAGAEAGAGADAGSSSNAAAGDAMGGGGGATTRLCALAALDGQDPLDQSGRIASSYLQALFSECRYQGLNCGVDLQGLPEFTNQLRPYGYDLWHCAGSPVNGFKLVYPSRKVTQADAEALIDLYVTLTTRRLLLSDSDAAELRLELLGLVVSSLDPNAARVSLCDSNGICPSSAASGGTGGGGAGAASNGTSGGGAAGAIAVNAQAGAG